MRYEMTLAFFLIVYPMKDGLPSAFGDDNLDDDAFETGLFVSVFYICKDLIIHFSFPLYIVNALKWL